MESKCADFTGCAERPELCKKHGACFGFRKSLECYREPEKDPMTTGQVELADKIMYLCREYRGLYLPGKPFIWIDNHETGEFLCYTLGEANRQMKDALGRI